MRHSTWLILRFTAYTVAIAGLCAGLRVLAENGEIAPFVENGLVEWLQFALIVAALAMLVLPIARNCEDRDLALATAMLFAIAAFRELDGVFDRIWPNPGWKIAPLVTLTRFVQNDMSKELDYILIGLAIFGIFLLRRWDMILVLLGSIGAKLAFGVFVHIPVRYVNFNNVGLLLALAVALYCIALATGLIARRSFRNHALLETRRPNCTSAGESS